MKALTVRGPDRTCALIARMSQVMLRLPVFEALLVDGSRVQGKKIVMYPPLYACL